MRNTILPLIVVLGLGGLAEAQTQTPQRHIRYVQGQTERDAELQIEVSTFKNADGVEVTLYGVVHIADSTYFQQVQKDLAKFDTVLYEGVKQGTKPNKETKGLNSIQHLMATVLGFQFQKDGIDYKQKNFVHADIDIDTLQKNMKGQSLNPMDRYFSPETMEKLAPLAKVAKELLKVYMDSKPELQDQLRMQMAKSLSGSDIEKQLPPQMKKAIIDDRNQIVMDVFDKQRKLFPKKKKICIFYGAGHNPDFIRRFTKRGYTQTKTRWMTAWKMGIGVSKSRITKDEIEKALKNEVR